MRLCFPVEDVLQRDAGEVIVHDRVEMLPEREREAVLGAVAAGFETGDGGEAALGALEHSATVISDAGRLRR